MARVPSRSRRPPAPDPMIRAIQRAYPQIYLACHVRHRPAHGDDGLTEREASLLAHLDDLSPVTAGDLARHLGIGPSTLSEALDTLVDRGLVTRSRSSRDRRRIEVRITDAGVELMQAGSVLDTQRLTAVLARIPAAERAAAVRGLERIATAARELMQAAPSRRSRS